MRRRSIVPQTTEYTEAPMAQAEHQRAMTRGLNTAAALTKMGYRAPRTGKELWDMARPKLLDLGQKRLASYGGPGLRASPEQAYRQMPEQLSEELQLAHVQRYEQESQRRDARSAARASFKPLAPPPPPRQRRVVPESDSSTATTESLPPLQLGSGLPITFGASRFMGHTR